MIEIAWVGASTERLERCEHVDAFAEAHALLEEAKAYPVVWVEADDGAWAEEVLKTLRSSDLYAFMPIFVSDRLEGFGAYLHDGVAMDAETVRQKAVPMLRRLEGLQPKELRSTAGLRLMTYLYIRPGSEVVSFRHWSNEWIDTYPIAELLNDTGIETAKGLEILERRGLLEKSRLLDRLRLCPKCERPHHNFVDVCPVDHSIEIEKVDFIHCFTCGYVGPENEFYREGIFICPNCKTQLRHIGVDYDRPLESYLCANGHKFVEPDVVAECLYCGAKNAPDALVAREIHAYALTPEGALAVRAGEISDLYAILDRTNYVHPDYFTSLVDWLLRLHRREPDEEFSILAIRLLNIAELVDALGRAKVMEFLDELATRLRELLRNTDVTTRTNETDIWILLPKTPAKGCEIVEKRLEKLKELIAYKERHIDFALACRSLQKGAASYGDAKTLMAEVAAQLAAPSQE
ncbi:TackOD1 domain-containing metal-binding protein [Hydrogenimonas sp.]